MRLHFLGDQSRRRTDGRRLVTLERRQEWCAHPQEPREVGGWLAPCVQYNEVRIKTACPGPVSNFDGNEPVNQKPAFTDASPASTLVGKHGSRRKAPAAQRSGTCRRTCARHQSRLSRWAARPPSRVCRIAESSPTRCGWCLIARGAGAGAAAVAERWCLASAPTSTAPRQGRAEAEQKQSRAAQSAWVGSSANRPSTYSSKEVGRYLVLVTHACTNSTSGKPKRRQAKRDEKVAQMPPQ